MIPNDEVSIMDEEDAAMQELRRFALAQIEAFKERGMSLLLQYKGNRNMALDCYALAHGWGDLIGMHSAVEISIKHFGNASKKAAVSKCVGMFRDCLGIKKMPGQRPDAGRANMSEGRTKQLKPKKQK